MATSACASTRRRSRRPAPLARLLAEGRIATSRGTPRDLEPRPLPRRDEPATMPVCGARRPVDERRQPRECCMLRARLRRPGRACPCVLPAAAGVLAEPPRGRVAISRSWAARADGLGSVPVVLALLRQFRAARAEPVRRKQRAHGRSSTTCTSSVRSAWRRIRSTTCTWWTRRTITWTSWRQRDASGRARYPRIGARAVRSAVWHRPRRGRQSVRR